jgi:predicted HicB family RNase H-like nuclease
MVVQRKPKQHQDNIKNDDAESFISGDSPPQKKRIHTVKKPVSLRFDAHLLDDIDSAAHKRGISRNAWISYWCSKGLEDENL